MYQNRTLVRADNLEEMRKFPDECVDLIATDPPFNSKRNYFVPYRDREGKEPVTLRKAFNDTWTWGENASETCEYLIVNVGGQIGDTLQGLQQFLDETPMMAYLVMMSARITEMHRILKKTGSLYLHCDPTASHYLKIILDAVFGTQNFRNEIVWHYKRWTAASRRFQKMHDVIFWYSKTDAHTFTQPLQPFSDESYIENTVRGFVDGKLVRLKHKDGNYVMRKTQKEGVLMHDVWHDINFIPPSSTERAGYPTQKPIELYKRIIRASSNAGDLVLDPFAGCGTTLMAAEELGRQWIGIDLTYLATGAVKIQVEKFFPQLRDSVTITGTPEDITTALELAREDPTGFEEWCVTHVLKFKANAKKVSDGGIDGTFNFPLGRVQGRQKYGKAVAQIKGGGYTLSHVRDFRTAMRNENAALGVFVVTTPPTQGMLTEASRAGTYKHPSYELSIPALQIYEIQDHFRGIPPKLPLAERSVL